MQQIADWLEKLGMSEYVRCFAENGISAAALPHLTDQDLKDISVLLGHRRIILAAVVQLGGPATPTPPLETAVEPNAQNRTEPLQQPPTPPAALPMSVATVAEGERRHVTVMFCDLVGSTALAARMDPEDLREIISSYQKCVAQTVQRFGGFVAKYMGDGVLVYFGYPRAHEGLRR
jgi:SAM domain (Sterile alpha motif)/Adenylate and Guanylate cyclase catalytic domain